MKEFDRILPETELCVMDVIWKNESGGGIGAGEITKELADSKGWKKATIHVILTRLVEKGYLTVDKSGYTHLYFPLISEDEYRTFESKQFVRRIKGARGSKSALKNFIASMIDSDDLTDEDIEELSCILKKRGHKNE